MPGRVLSASALVPAPRESVFAFLSDLEHHWELTDRFVEVLELQGPEGARNGGRVRVHGPLGVRRTADTSVERTRAPELIEGTARLGGTSACVRWRLEPAGETTTRVELSATVLTVAPLDAAVLAAGGGRWMRSRLAATLSQLAERFAEPAARLSDAA